MILGLVLEERDREKDKRMENQEKAFLNLQYCLNIKGQ